MKKSFLKDRRGESLVETLVAILIFTLASIALYSTVTSAARVNGQARALDQSVQEQLEVVEMANEVHSGGSVIITTDIDHPITVDVYGGGQDEDGKTTLYSYYKKPTGGTRP